MGLYLTDSARDLRFVVSVESANYLINPLLTERLQNTSGLWRGEHPLEAEG